MRVDVVAFTARGLALARRIAEALAAEGDETHVSSPPRLAERYGAQAYESLARWAAEAFSNADALLFVGACGIAVRTVAPFLRDKLQDPAVVCVDEQAHFAVSLLSGHVGGANALARKVAALCGAQAVVTTATDAGGVFAVDEWAARQGLAILDRQVAKEVSTALLEGRTVGFASDADVAGDVPEGLVTTAGMPSELGIVVSLDTRRRPFASTLRLVPRVVTVGVGCRRGTSESDLMQALEASLAEAHVAHEAVCALASIDLKADEPGLLQLADQLGVPLRLHSAQELRDVSGDFASSEFVERTVGVGNVCERAACAAGERILLGRRAYGNVTIALAASEPHLSFDESAEEGER